MVRQGAKLDWNDKKAVLSLPNGQKLPVVVMNNCPYVNLNTVNAIKKWKAGLEKQRTLELKKLW